MPHISLRLSDDEKNLMDNYAKLNNTSLSNIIKKVFFEKLEDEYDLKTIREYEADPNKKMYSHEEVGRLLGLE